MTLLLNRRRPGCLDLIKGNEILVLFRLPPSPFNSVVTPCKINCLTEQPRKAARDLSWR